MPLETGTYISDLDAANPVGSTDKVQTLDDHVRLLKSTIKASFPGVTGAVTPTHTELNFVDGVTGAIQTQIDGKAATSHAHSAADLTSGTVPDARFPATLPAISGENLTNLDASDLASGTVPDARLSSNIPKKDAANTFSAAGSASTPPIRVGTSSDNFTTGASTLVGLAAAGGASLAIRDETNNVELIAGANNSEGAFVGSITSHKVSVLVGGSMKVEVATTGAITTLGTSAAEFGYAGVPNDAAGSGSRTLTLADRNKHCYAGNGVTLTIPANASVAYPIGTTLTFVSVSGAGTASIAITSDTMYLAGTALATTGTRTLAAGGMATALKISATEWIISGNVS